MNKTTACCGELVGEASQILSQCRQGRLSRESIETHRQSSVAKRRRVCEELAIFPLALPIQRQSIVAARSNWKMELESETYETSETSETSETAK